MWRAVGWRGLVVAVVVWGAAAAVAEQVPGTVSRRSVAAPSDDACKAACGGLITRCAGVFGPAMGDMRPFCERAVLRRCRAGGIGVCEPAVTRSD